MIRAALIRWLQGPPLSGRLALLCGVIAVASATIIRAAIDDMVMGCEFTPYLPFILLSAILLRWWQAVLVALASVPVFGLSFIGSPAELLGSVCFLSSALIYLAASAAMIGAVMFVRRLFLSMHRAGADETQGGIVLSLKDGEVWACWYGQGLPVLLGSQAKVSAMMKDFLAQLEIGKRFNGQH